MSYNGSGTFNINTAGQPVVTGTTITSTAFNLLTADLATGLTTALTKDGQTTPTANIPMGGFKITGLAAGSAATDAAQYGQLQAGATTIATVSGTDTLTGSLTPAIAAYATGNLFSFVAAATNTGAATINLNSLGAKSITKSGATALVAGDIVSGQVYLIEYDGTRFQLINPSSVSGVSSISFGSTGLTPSTATGGSITVAGTLAIANGGTGTTSTTFVNAATNVTGTLPIANGGTNSTATATAGGVGYGTGTAHAYTSAGTSGQILTSAGSGAPVWATPATTSSGLTLVQTVTASGSTVLIDGFSSTYDNYTLRIADVYPSADGRNLELKFYLGGTLISADYQYAYSNVNSSSSASDIGSASTSQIRLANSMDQTTFNRSNDYVIDIFGVNGTSTYKSIIYNGVYHFSDTTYSIRGVGTQTVTTGALTAIQIAFPGSSFGGGKFQLYGYAKA